ncbi:hypothetical protein SMD20_05655 [Nonomuraea sp. LP-02]|uniref:hypothetical protein n=1 Tax=Nonomuraea sp. LP-02 TaxID=3097960 RepID=UPI002E357452|nr:hypothetical protein [Nonomuraea sp. LP-02]MED7923703.1 hypothetical protein [Nonomuraea sp. LP-02]
MADGTEKPIEDVEVGDKVQATDPVSGRTEAKPVTALIAGEGAWVYAAQLHAGTWLQTGDGTWVQVSAVEKWTAAQHVHNLSVDGIPTYYVGVGRASVLVHNTPCPDDADGVDHALDRHGHDSYGKSDDGVWDEDMDEDASVNSPEEPPGESAGTRRVTAPSFTTWTPAESSVAPSEAAED